MIVTHAMVLAAGYGKRMLPLTESIPKPLVKVAGRPLIDYALVQLQRAGIQQAVVNTHYLAELLEAYLQERSTTPQVEVSYEDLLLETGGGIVHALPMLGNNPFFAINSDTITYDLPGHTPALARLAAHYQPHIDIVMLLQPTANAVGYQGAGDFIIDSHGMRRRGDDAHADYVFTGVQLIHPRVMSGQAVEPFSMNRIYDQLIDTQTGYFTPRLGYVIHEGDWLHIGDPIGLELAESYFAQHMGSGLFQETIAS